VINEKQNAVLLIAGFTQREISGHKRKFYNLFEIWPRLEPHQWVGLTDEEVKHIADSEWEEAFVRLIEAKLKEKNT
jgi:hypothetical protein